MNPSHAVSAASPVVSAAMPALPDDAIPALVAEVFEAAPVAERSHLLEQLLRPLGVLSLFGVAGGVFANIRFRSGWQDMHVQVEDVQRIGAAQVMALVDRAQQVSVETVDGLSHWLMASPALSGSAAAALLLSLLLQRARQRQAQQLPRAVAGP